MVGSKLTRGGREERRTHAHQRGGGDAARHGEITMQLLLGRRKKEERRTHAHQRGGGDAAAHGEITMQLLLGRRKRLRGTRTTAGQAGAWVNAHHGPTRRRLYLPLPPEQGMRLERVRELWPPYWPHGRWPATVRHSGLLAAWRKSGVCAAQGKAQQNCKTLNWPHPCGHSCGEEVA